MKNLLRQSILDGLIYSTVYFFSFLLSSKLFVDGGETAGMYFLINTFLTIIIFFGAVISGLIISSALGKRLIILKAILFFIICEIVTFLFLSEIAFFGLFINQQDIQTEFHGQNSIALDIYYFRKYRNMSFSIAGLMASLILILKYYLFNNIKSTTDKSK